MKRNIAEDADSHGRVELGACLLAQVRIVRAERRTTFCLALLRECRDCEAHRCGGPEEACAPPRRGQGEGKPGVEIDRARRGQPSDCALKNSATQGVPSHDIEAGRQGLRDIVCESGDGVGA